MAPWQRNLWTVWLSQFMGMIGFSLALPFIPYYIQHLGVTDPDAVKFWSAASASTTAATLALMAPVWGVLADRYGRKPMMLRANFGAVVILGLMAYAPNVQTFIALRAAQGLVTGTVTAAMTLVACSTPVEKQGVALGTLSTAVFSGSMIGAALGGLLADLFGYRTTFLCGAAVLLVSGFVVLFGVREQFVPEPPADPATRPEGWRARLAALGPGVPILLLIFLMAVARQFDGPIVPLFIQDLNGGLDGAARWSGLVSGCAGLGAMVAGYVMGRLADRVSPLITSRLAALGGGFFMLLIGFVNALPWLLVVRPCMAFCGTGLEPAFNVWLSRCTPASRRGTMFGWAVTAKSVGWVVTPMLSATVAVHAGNRAVFWVGPFLFWLLIPTIAWVGRRVGPAGHPVPTPVGGPQARTEGTQRTGRT